MKRRTSRTGTTQERTQTSDDKNIMVVGKEKSKTDQKSFHCKKFVS